MVPALVNRGIAYYELHEFNKAVDCYKEALSKSNDPIIYNNLGNAYKAMGSFEDARSSYKKANIFPLECAKAFKHLGLMEFELRRYEEALEPLKKYLKFVPYDSNTNLDIANTYKQIGNYAEAEEYAKNVIRLNPNNEADLNDAAYDIIGLCAYFKNGYEEAAKNFILASEADPQYAAGFNNAGAIRSKQNCH